MMRRPARQSSGWGHSLCAPTSGGSLRPWAIRPQRQCIPVRTYSSLSSFSLFFVLTTGYASYPLRNLSKRCLTPESFVRLRRMC
jgi:hypothetical protein